MNSMLMDKNTYDKWQELLDKEEQDEKDKEIERLNNIINEMEQFFIDNANDEMKKCFDKLHSLKGSDKE